MKISRPVGYTLLIVVAVAAFVLTEESPQVQPKKKSVTAKSNTGGSSLFTKEDYEASFAPLTVGGKNAFVPLVVRSDSFMGGTLPPSAIPADFADGESSWNYTGSAVIDGVPVVLFENSTTQEGVFLKQGERWKSSHVIKITPGSVVIGSGGATRTLSLAPFETFSEVPPLDATAAARQAMNSGMVIRPESSNASSRSEGEDMEQEND